MAGVQRAEGCATGSTIAGLLSIESTSILSLSIESR